MHKLKHKALTWPYLLIFIHNVLSFKHGKITFKSPTPSMKDLLNRTHQSFQLDLFCKHKKIGNHQHTSKTLRYKEEIQTHKMMKKKKIYDLFRRAMSSKHFCNTESKKRNLCQYNNPNNKFHLFCKTASFFHWLFSDQFKYPSHE